MSSGICTCHDCTCAGCPRCADGSEDQPQDAYQQGFDAGYDAGYNDGSEDVWNSEHQDDGEQQPPAG